MTRLESAVPPPDMWKGSRGTMVNVWLVALKAWALGEHLSTRGVVADGVLGDCGVQLTASFQSCYGLEADGGVGPATRAKAKRVLDFNFDEVAAATPGETVFVQADGEEVIWAPAPPRLEGRGELCASVSSRRTMTRGSQGIEFPK
jgi:hypothetical protein